MFLSKIERMILRAPEDDKGGGGGGGDDKNKGENVTMSKADHAALMDRITKLESKGSKGSRDDDESDDEDDEEEERDLTDKARKIRDRENKGSNDTKALEAAIQFTMDAPKFLKDNASLLPKTINDIFTAADKENYASRTEKAAAIKAGVIKDFFSVQANLDLLTPGLKNQLEDYLKLTNTGRVERASQMYDSIFEPALEMLRRTKKAEALSKGHGTGGDDGYKQRLMQGSRKHYLGEKNSGS